jgi:hypothetical protein
MTGLRRIHSTTVPGTETMTQLKDQLHWDLQKTPRGSRMVITADNKEALDAVHEFLRFQIEDHKTGDCPAYLRNNVGHELAAVAQARSFHR